MEIVSLSWFLQKYALLGINSKEVVSPGETKFDGFFCLLRRVQDAPSAAAFIAVNRSSIDGDGSSYVVRRVAIDSGSDASACFVVT